MPLKTLGMRWRASAPLKTEKTLAGRWLSTGLNAVSRRVVSVNPNPRGRAGGLLALSQRILWRLALTGSSMERRLAAILSADVVAYTRLIEADEVGTFERLKKLRLDHVEPLVSAHHGRIFKLTGDGALAEFPSATEAVQCAVKIQDIVQSEEAAQPENQAAHRLQSLVG